jgi:RimJ/RimL family protein N-acetyltransferase
MGTIRTLRLELIPLTPEAIEKLMAGDRRGAEATLGVTFPDEFPAPGERDGFLPIQLERMGAAPKRRDWMARIMVSRGDDRVAIGHCGFHGPPEMIGRAEIGYTVFTHYRGQGYAKEAAAALVEWAFFVQGENDVYASVAPDNAPSLAVVRSLGFTQIGTQIDEVDGLELVFVRRRDAASAPKA